jgi:hypothetical protein
MVHRPMRWFGFGSGRSEGSGEGNAGGEKTWCIRAWDNNRFPRTTLSKTTPESYPQGVHTVILEIKITDIQN